MEQVKLSMVVALIGSIIWKKKCLAVSTKAVCVYLLLPMSQENKCI